MDNIISTINYNLESDINRYNILVDMKLDLINEIYLNSVEIGLEDIEMKSYNIKDINFELKKYDFYFILYSKEIVGFYELDYDDINIRINYNNLKI